MNLARSKNKPQRAVLYGRVSAVMGRGDDLTSPELQEHVARDYCARRGYEPVRWLCDVDETGRSWSRRQVEQAVQMIERHEVDVIVVPRWSRFTRNLRDYVMQTACVEAAGGRVESALEETDPATAAGLLQRDLFAILAQWESRKIGEQWKETHQRRLREGLPHNMIPRMGYRIVKGRYRRHPIEGPIVTELYTRYLDGSGIVTLTHWLAAQGVLSRVTGQRWSPRRLQLMMASGFAAGLLHVGDGHLPGAHSALISPEVWEGYNRCRAERWAGSTLRMGAYRRACNGWCLRHLRAAASTQGRMVHRPLADARLYVCVQQRQRLDAASVHNAKGPGDAGAAMVESACR